MSKIYKAFLANEKAIRRVFARYFRVREDVDDLTQETFIKCFAAEVKNDIHDPRAFLFRAAKNLAYSERRKKFRVTTDYIEDNGGTDAMVDEKDLPAEARLDSQRKMALLMEAVATLPDEYRQAFLMRKVDQLKLSQIAMRTDVTVRTAQKRVAVALDMCDAYLRKKGYAPQEYGRMAEPGGAPADEGDVSALPPSMSAFEKRWRDNDD